MLEKIKAVFDGYELEGVEGWEDAMVIRQQSTVVLPPLTIVAVAMPVGAYTVYDGGSINWVPGDMVWKNLKIAGAPWELHRTPSNSCEAWGQTGRLTWGSRSSSSNPCLPEPDEQGLIYLNIGCSSPMDAGAIAIQYAFEPTA